ncbi:glycosyltransferase family protein [Nocardiopsis xinjiangensis]|uniref:glycosyltransferase family 1 protein n=1 Tax=Nocardiopsis xinjiangensis TaxID=124285 RepID=UPI000346BB53|nr:glycosyltransferase family 1 protein [Nocardiopsis xinjiangensis]
MIPKLRALLADLWRRVRTHVSKRMVFALAAACVALLVVFVGGRVGLAASCLFLLGGIAWAGRSVKLLRREERGTVAVPRPRSRTAADDRYVQRLRRHLWGGFSTTALEELREFSASPTRTPESRTAALSAAAEWYTALGEHDRAGALRHAALLSDPRAPVHTEPPEPLPAGPVHFDVLLVSDFCNLGGTTGSNLQEVAAQAAGGLRTGLLHNPFGNQRPGRPVNPKFNRFVDGGRVRYVRPGERVTCDLMIVRHPRSVERLQEDLPHVTARATKLVVNQTPCRYYGEEGAGEEVWDVAETHRVLQDWIGNHEWCPISPFVRRALLEHHTDELGPVRLSEHDWTNIIDLDEWRGEGPLRTDGAVRIGRHSRDHASKWPETPELLSAAYPAGEGYEVHVLGGTAVPRRMFGSLPEGWVSHEYDSVPAAEFLRGLDVYVYQTASDLLEAFGRAPLEAMAAGVPTVLPPKFEELFGPAAVYADPGHVRDAVNWLFAVPGRSREQVEQAWAVLGERFSHGSHLRRLAALGVQARPAQAVPGV